MAVAFLLEIPGFTPEQSAAVLQELGLDKNPAAGISPFCIPRLLGDVIVPK